MHQPDYRDATGVMQMPWVFLHAIKDYKEMLERLRAFKNLKASFNLTAPLIEQLRLCKEPLRYDAFFMLWHKEPSELSQSQKESILKTIRSMQYETMVVPNPYFAHLFTKEHLTQGEFIDLELSWCSYTLKSQNATLLRLIAKQEGYTQTDKSELLSTLAAFTQTILPLYAQLQNQGVIAVSTTPYNHPILPLLLDMQNAKRANPHTTLPQNPLSLKSDAILQIERSIALYKDSFGVAPKGFWPAEGAVCEESLMLYKERGIEWVATDEAILFASCDESSRDLLYEAYDFKGMSIGFRDRELSDLIGFTYRYKSPKSASDHFLALLTRIAEQKEDATLFVILDGENAWEFFANDAHEFFLELYERLSQTAWIKTITMDAITQQKKSSLQKLFAGSWIHGNFDTWSGHAEKNRAWELIYQTKRDYIQHEKRLSQERKDEADFHFLAAECSDWFWWYGDDHSTEFSAEFDTLFRSHLLHIYHLLAIDAPPPLHLPIHSHKEKATFMQRPEFPISPNIRGKLCSFFEGLGAGVIDESRLYSTMEARRGPIEKIYFGQDAHAIYLAFEGDAAELEKMGTKLIITVEESLKSYTFLLRECLQTQQIQTAFDERMELRLEKSLFDGLPSIHLRFELQNETKIIQNMPAFGALAFDLDESYSANWFV